MNELMNRTAWAEQLRGTRIQIHVQQRMGGS